MTWQINWLQTTFLHFTRNKRQRCLWLVKKKKKRFDWSWGHFIILVHKVLHLFMDFPFFYLSFMGALMLIQACSFSLAKTFIWDALQGLTVVCFKCKILHLLMNLSRYPWMGARRGFCLWLHQSVCGRRAVIFQFLEVKMLKITLMFPDPTPPSSSNWKDRSVEGTGQQGVMVNFPGLGLGPSFSSDVTVLGISLEKPAVAVLAI